jgi:WD40 repeat protein
VAFSPNGQILASASRDNTVKLWDLTKGMLRGTLTGHSSSVEAVAFSLDGQLLASASSDHTIRLWDIGTKKMTEKINVKELITELSFSDNGLYLMTNRGAIELSDIFGRVLHLSQISHHIYTSESSGC